MVFGQKKKDLPAKRIEVPDDDTEEEFEDGYDQGTDEEDEYDEPIQPIRRKTKKLPPLPDTWTVREVPTSVEKVFFNNKTNKVLDLHSAMVKIMNDMEEILSRT